MVPYGFPGLPRMMKDDDEISDTSTIYNALEVAPSHVEVIDELGTFIFSFIDIM